jgi:capsular polysaccharide biosynthesis protein
MSANTDFEYGTYLSPQNRHGEQHLCLIQRAPRRRQAGLGGLIYTDNEEIVKASIDHRFSSVSLNKSLPIEDKSSDEFLFLGYCFRHYGHFILETLPMLSYCLDDRWLEHKKIFLPYFLSPKNLKNQLTKKSNLIHSFMHLLGIDTSKVYFHTNYTNLKSNFIVPPKAVNGDRFQIDGSLHAQVIAKIKSNYTKKAPTKKILVIRSIGRMTSAITEYVHTFAMNNSIELVDMAKLSIEEQIQLIHETKYLIGFSGSAMHNSMFLQPEAMAINICDFRDFKSPTCYIPNQKLCNRISQCQEYFIDFKFQSDMKKEYFAPSNIKQQKFAAMHIINQLQTII